MSMSKEKREHIRKYILEKAADRDEDIIQKVIDTFSVSRPTAYKYINELLSQKKIKKNGKHISIVNQSTRITIDMKERETLSEDIIYERNVFPLLKGLPQNVVNMWDFCTLEMLNNVIDHSQASVCDIYVIQNDIYTEIVIADNGIGIFQNIKDHFGFHSIDDAIVELFKGKLTTDRLHHSGEGIFFSSRIMDVFAAVSDGKVFSHTDFDESLKDLENAGVVFEKGTIIFMRLSNQSRKTNKDIMNLYADPDGGFIKTEIPIRLMFDGYPVSRSQAKRLYNRFDAFQTVELDFSGVEDIGQGFADELFVVFRRFHPETELIVHNASFEVQRMISHVTNSAKKRFSLASEDDIM